MRQDGRQRPELLGRARECEALDRLLANTLEGQSQVMVLRGEAGAGKSSLLGYLSANASGWRVVSVVGVESEMELAYGGLHQICAPVLSLLERLPDPQREALETVFGMTTGPAPDRFLVGLATLTLLAEAAEQQPLLCVVDDAHWLDHTSAQLLGFVARRLLAERITLVCASRLGMGDHFLAGVSDLHIGGLADDDARALLLSNVHGPIDAAVCDRIVAESRGNPLALVELPRTWTTAGVAGGYGIPAGNSVASKIEQSYERRLAQLPLDTQLLVLAASAESLGDPVLLHNAVEGLGIDMGAAGPAVDAGLVTIAGRVEFAHPLVRSVAYRSAAEADRHRVHRALGEATDPERDPDRRAWHLARAAAGPDEEIATELERSAARAQARGGLAAAAAFLRRAAELTADPDRRAERALTAAERSFQAGELDTAQQLLATAESHTIDGLQAARASLLRGHFATVVRYGNDAARLLLEAAKQFEAFDLDLAREAYVAAYGSAMAAGHLGEQDALRDICLAIKDLPQPQEADDGKSLLLEGLARMHTDGHAVATPILQRAANAVGHLPEEDVIRWGWMAPAAAHATWDSDRSSAIFQRQAELIRSAGALTELPVFLSGLALDRTWNGDFDGSQLLIAESDTVAAATGNQLPPYAALRLLSMQGREAEASALIAATIEQATAQGQGNALRVAQWAAAVLYNGLARYDKAFAAAREVTTDDLDPYPNMWVLPELVEAAVRVGEAGAAQRGLDRLVEMTRPAGTDWALGTEARSRALLSDGDRADGLYCEAIERFGRTGLRPELARAQLLYGEWLRREGRRVEARGQLHAAHDMFGLIGMDGFAERARRELTATGDKAPKRTAETRDDLTPQEAQIAELARQGYSNPEIGAQLFLSPRTIEWHLRKVFAKLDISSRKELDTALNARRRQFQPL